MLNFVLALIMMLIIIVGGFGFLVWAWREHLIASRYRNLIRTHQIMQQQGKFTAPPINNVGPQWEVTYKEKGGKITTMNIVAETESDLARELFKKGLDYARVVKFSKL